MFFQIKSFTAMSLSLSLHVIEHIFNRSKHTRYCSPNKKGKKQRLKDWKQSKLKVEVFVPLQKINALINFFFIFLSPFFGSVSQNNLSHRFFVIISSSSPLSRDHKNVLYSVKRKKTEPREISSINTCSI